MAFITIITGSHEFRDDFGYFQAALSDRRRYRYNIDGVEFLKSRFERVVITKDGDVITLPPVIANLGGGKYSCTQTLGSCKTILGVEHLAKIHKVGGNTDGNLSVAFFKRNLNKEKKNWAPSVNSLADFDRLNKTNFLLDDIKGTISRWNSSEAEFIGAIVNKSRKEHLSILITTQRVINFVPPDIRAVASSYEIPYATIRDQRQFSPDGVGMPLEIEVLSISANGVFIGFGSFNSMGVPDGATILPTEKSLNSYSTLQVAVDLKAEDAETTQAEELIKEPYSGYNNERIVFNELAKCVGELRHLSAKNNNEHLADIEFLAEGKRYLIDVVGVNGKGTDKTLNTDFKDIAEWVEGIKKMKAVPLFAYETNNKVRFLTGNALIGKEGNIRLSKALIKKSHSVNFYFTKKDM